MNQVISKCGSFREENQVDGMDSDVRGYFRQHGQGRPPQISEPKLNQKEKVTIGEESRKCTTQPEEAQVVFIIYFCAQRQLGGWGGGTKQNMLFNRQ